MPALEFLTVINASTQARAQAIFDRFSRASGISLHGQFDSWDNLWHDVVNTGIYRKGSDFGELGTTWLDSLVEMNALRPFSSRDIAQLGGVEAFIPSVWNNLQLRSHEEMWGIPARADPRVLWYWKDMVEDSGLDPQQAFSTFEQFPETFSKLTKVIPTPWVVNTNARDAISVHTIASWIWETGGDFISEDGKRILFMEPRTLRAITDYFDLYRFMRPDYNINGTDSVNMFARREVAAVIGGPWIFAGLAEHHVPPETVVKLGVTTIPGPNFIGGTALIIWHHCREYDKALEAIQHLVSPEVQAEYPSLIDLMPVRQETWKMAPYATDPVYQTLYQALLRGRSMPVVPLWGMIEDRLVKTISQVWSELFTVPNSDTAQVVSKHFGAYARRLSLALDR